MLCTFVKNSLPLLPFSIEIFTFLLPFPPPLLNSDVKELSAGEIVLLRKTQRTHWLGDIVRFPAYPSQN